MPPRGKNLDTQSRTRETPTALPGCCLDMKCVVSSGQSCIVHHPLIAAGLVPLLIQSFKLVAIPVYRIIRITKCCELHRERALLVRERYIVHIADRLFERRTTADFHWSAEQSKIREDD